MLALSFAFWGVVGRADGIPLEGRRVSFRFDEALDGFDQGRLDELIYPFHDHTILVTHCGRICFKGRKVNLSQVFAGQRVGVTQVGERIWLVTFMHDDVGYFDDETCRLEPIENPFGPKVLPMSSE